MRSDAPIVSTKTAWTRRAGCANNGGLKRAAHWFDETAGAMDQALADRMGISNTPGATPALAAVGRGGVSLMAKLDMDAADASAKGGEWEKGEDHAGS